MKNTANKLGLFSVMTAALVFAVAPSPARAQESSGAPPPDVGAGGFFAEESVGFLGVGVEEVTPDEAKELKMPVAYGVAVTGVDENGPAAKAGLRKGDVIVQYNDQRVEGTAEFRRLVRETPPGHTAVMSVWRDGHAEKFSVDVAHAPESAARNDLFSREPAPSPRDFGPGVRSPLLPGQEYGNRGFASTPSLGVAAMDLSGQLGEYFGAPNDEGVLVVDVHKNSAGEKAGLKAGDVITKVNGEPVRNVGELRQHLREARDSKSVTLGIVRKGSEISVMAEPELPEPPAAPRDLERRIPL